jgi:MSHA biogenesis protein MshP
MKHNTELHGFALVSAIFLLVVILALGVFAVTISSIQQQNSAMDVLGSRAYQAAKTGIEWGVYQITNGATCPLPTPTMPAGTQLSAFTVLVTCTSSTHTEGTATFSVYQLDSVAHTGSAVGTPGYVEREIQIVIKN